MPCRPIIQATIRPLDLMDESLCSSGSGTTALLPREGMGASAMERAIHALASIDCAQRKGEESKPSLANSRQYHV